MSTKRALRQEIQQYRQAEALLNLGARVPIVMEMTNLSNWFLRKLALELRGEAPRKGQIPNSDLWYLRRRHNTQASLFCCYYEGLKRRLGEGGDECQLLIEAYRHFQQTLSSLGQVTCLPIDRAWWLLKAVKIRALQRICCQACHGRFVQPWGRVERFYICWECRQQGFRIGRRGLPNWRGVDQRAH